MSKRIAIIVGTGRVACAPGALLERLSVPLFARGRRDPDAAAKHLYGAAGLRTFTIAKRNGARADAAQEVLHAALA